MDSGNMNNDGMNNANNNGNFSNPNYNNTAAGNNANYYSQQTQQPQYMQPEVETPVSIGDWVLTIFLAGIPCVNIILLFVWAFGSNQPKSKSNWAKAQLIWMLIAIVVTILIYAIFGAAFFTAVLESTY